MFLKDDNRRSSIDLDHAGADVLRRDMLRTDHLRWPINRPRHASYGPLQEASLFGMTAFNPRDVVCTHWVIYELHTTDPGPPPV